MPESNIRDVIREHALTMFIVVMALATRVATSEERVTVARVARLLVAGVFVGSVSALALEGTDYSEPFKGAVIGIAALLSEDLLSFVLSLARAARNNPEKTACAIFSKFWRK